MAFTGVAAAFFRPSTTGLVRDLVPDEELQSANAMLSTISSGASIAGPSIAGLLVSLTNPGVSLCIDAATFVVSAVLLGGMNVARKGAPRERKNVFAEIADGFREVRDRTWLSTTIVFMAVFQLTALACVNTLGPLVADESLGGAKAWGVIVTGFAVGTLLGGIAGGFVHPDRLLVAAILSGLFVIPTLVLLARGGPTWALVITQCLTGTGIVFSGTVYSVAMQQFVPPDKLSRVSSFDTVGSGVLYPVGLGVAGPLSVAIGLRPTLLGAAVIVLVAALVAVSLPSVNGLRRNDPEPAAAAA
jgi:MFS family permease